MTKSTEITVYRNGTAELVYRPGMIQALQFRRSGKLVWGAKISRIAEWADAPAECQERAIKQHQARGLTPDTSNIIIVATDRGSIVTIASAAAVASLRPLLAEAKAAREAEEAARKAEEAARKAAYEARCAEVVAACPADCEPCTLGKWFDGIQTYIAADGTKFDAWDGLDAHGVGIVYVSKKIVADARESAAKRAEAEKAAAEKAAAKKAERAAHRDECFRRARETGSKIAIRRYTTECHDPNAECSLDTVTEWAMPDGTTSETWQHTW